MKLGLRLEGLPHCPRNRSHTIKKKGKFSYIGKTKIAEAYEKAVKQELASKAEEVEAFSKAFDKEKHALHAHWILRSPDVMTKTGKISENGTDLDAHKVLQDTIFDVLGIDDAYVVDDHRSKVQGDYLVLLYLTIVEV